MEELRECPFCGGKARINRVQDICPNYVIRCWECRASTKWFRDKKQAIEQWNTRPDSWISVEDKLPDTRTVLGCNIDGYVTAVVYMCYVKKWAIAHNMRVTMDVTHWMPLPEPPKGDEN